MSNTTDTTPGTSDEMDFQVENAMSFDDLKRMIAGLPAEASIYIHSNESCPDLEVNLSDKGMLSVKSRFSESYKYDKAPATVGEFAKLLLDAQESIKNRSLVFITSNIESGTLNGIRMNANGSFTLCSEPAFD